MADEKGTIRCAIYCRVSTPEPNSDFTSLDNQREMSETYIQSQASQGWVTLDQRYDDAGFSGGTMERPALDRLLRDVQDGLVDCIVVAKIDRLSRSLLDFARIVDILDRHGVAFVSVTQQWDTSSSMGKLTLNILLSFAQFEREMIAERTREKMVAARKKGKWTGGIPPLGYDTSPKVGKLIVNRDEAVRVQGIFDLYLKHESLMASLAEMRKRNWRTKSWTTKRGRIHEGKPFQKGSLRRLLTSPIYLGKISYAGQIYDAEHEGIVEPATWEQVQAILKRNGSNGGRRVRNRHGALLKGILHCSSCDTAMVHSFTKKNGRAYRYYVCSGAQRSGWETCPTKSIPAEEIEQCIYERIRAIGSDPALVEETITSARNQIAEQTTQLNAEIRTSKQRLRRLRDEERSLLESIGRGGSVASQAADRLNQVAEEKQSVTSNLAELERQLSIMQEQSLDTEDLTAAIAQFDPIWEVLLPRERAKVIRLLIHRVDFDGRSGTIGITFQPSGIKTLLAETTSPKSENA